METREPLERIADALEEILRLLQDFTRDGMPLQAQVPSAALLASLVASLAVLLKGGSEGAQIDRTRAEAAQPLGDVLIEQHDKYQQSRTRHALQQQLKD